jgi:hypothetical protein
MKSECCSADTIRVTNKALERDYDVCKKCGLPWVALYEEWRDIKGYEKYYEISNKGKVRRKKYMKEAKNGKEYYFGQKDIKLTNAGGYLVAGLTGDDGQKFYRVHNLMAEAWLPKKRKYQTRVEHITQNKLDNSYLNLRWIKT